MQRDTFALGLIGQGIGGSLTPGMHEAEARAQGFGLTYRRIDLDSTGDASIAEILAWARRFGLDGYNVTHPVKQSVIPLMDVLSPLAERVGAVNTVVVRPDGALEGHNTDALGFARMLTDAIPGAFDGPVVQLGAGGAGSATAHALLARGVPHLTVIDIDADRRSRLVESLAAAYGSDRVDSAATPDQAVIAAAGLVNATPIGMDHHPGSPIDVALLRPSMWVADIIYSPAVTELIAAADTLGCRVVGGGGMAVAQAVESFELFTGRPADAERMAATFKAALSERGY